MAAQQFTPPTVRDYRYLNYSLYSHVAGNLNSQISNETYLGQPLQKMVRDIQAVLSHNDPSRKFPTAYLRGTALREYFKALLEELHTHKPITSQIEYAVERGDWKGITLLPVPYEIDQQQKKSAENPQHQQKKEPGSDLSPDETLKINPPRASASKKPDYISVKEKAKTPEEVAQQPGEKPVIVRKNRFLHEFLQGARERLSFQKSVSTGKQTAEPDKATFVTRPLPPTRRFAGRLALPNRRLNIPGVLQNPAKNLISSTKVFMIRNPEVMVRILSAAIGATIGGILGRSPLSALGGAAIGAITGPNVLSGMMNMGVPENSGQESTSGVEQSSGNGGSGSRGGGGGAKGLRSLRSTARNLARGGRLAAQIGSRLVVLLGNPVTWLVMGIALLVLVVVLMIMCVIPFAGCEGTGNSGSTVPKPGNLNIKLEKKAPEKTENGQEIVYQIIITNNSTKAIDAVVKDKIPEKTTYVSGDNDPVPEGTGVAEAKWTVKGLPKGESKTLNLTIKPLSDDVWVVNKVIAEALSSTASISYGSIDTTGLLPEPLPAPVGNWNNLKAQILDAVNKYPEVVAAYRKAADISGVPWQILAGLHYVETGNTPNPGASLVSGRKIGNVEPDINPAKCAAGQSGPGVPVPLGGGCGFTTFEDSAIYSAKHIVEKNIGEDGKTSPPKTFKEAVTSLSHYNGGGNSNCGRGVPYNYCPEDFDGEDDPYSMNYFDQKHSEMYLIYCADFTKCSPPRPFGRSGAMTVIRALLEGN